MLYSKNRQNGISVFHQKKKLICNSCISHIPNGISKRHTLFLYSIGLEACKFAFHFFQGLIFSLSQMQTEDIFYSYNVMINEQNVISRVLAIKEYFTNKHISFYFYTAEDISKYAFKNTEIYIYLQHYMQTLIIKQAIS